MSLKHGILGLLNNYGMSGYDLMKSFDSSLSYFWHVRTSQIYLELSKMAKDELITSETFMQENRPNKKIFTITEKGKKELKNWMLNFDMKKSFAIKNEFLMLNFFLGEFSKAEALTVLENYKLQCEDELSKLSETANHIEYYKGKIDNKTAPIFWELTAKHGEITFKACLEWVSYSIEKIKKLDF